MYAHALISTYAHMHVNVIKTMWSRRAPLQKIMKFPDSRVAWPWDSQRYWVWAGCHPNRYEGSTWLSHG